MTARPQRRLAAPGGGAVRLLVVAAAALAGQACFPARYLAQAAHGQYALLHAARPIRQVARDGDTPERVRRLLRSVPMIKAYGRSRGLRPTRSYERYADLDREAAVWVVLACAPLRFDVRRWRFPLVGTVPYLGFFDREDALRYGEALARRDALDVHVRGAGAYSTLGWFPDPVLSTMIAGGDEALGELANVVLHESVHATVYVKSQSAFNESLASFVADRLTLEWLALAAGPDAPPTRAWSALHERRRARAERLHAVYRELDALYRSDASDARKLEEKGRILERVREELQLRGTLNNATLAGHRTYDTGGPAFERLLAACGGSPRRMLAAVGTLGERDFARPQQEEVGEVIDRLAAGGCPQPGSRRGARSRAW